MSTSRKENLRPEPVPIRKFIKLIFQLLLVLAVLGGLLIILFLCSPIALGSLWGLIPGGIICMLFILRTAKEDRMLREESAGYQEYTRMVRYRLFPGIW